MKKLIIIVIIVAGAVWAYFWYVQGKNLLRPGAERPDIPAYAIPTDRLGAVKGPRWEAAAPMPTPRGEVGVAAVDGKIYVVGGLDARGRTLDTVEAYDPLANEWSTVAPLPEKLHHIALVAHGGLLFAAGGLEGLSFTASDSFYSYEPSENRWRRRAALPKPVGAGAAASVRGHIYYFGGRTALGSVPWYRIYDPAADKWVGGGEMNSVRDHLGVAAVGGTAYVVGGRGDSLANNTDKVETLDVTTGEVGDAAPMPTPRGGIAVTSLGGLVYVFGGEAPTTTFAAAEAFDPATGRWASLPDMPTPRHGLGVAALHGRHYVIGGGRRPGFSVSDVNEVFIP